MSVFWNSAKMADVFNLQMGKTPDRSNAAYWNGSETWVAIGDMGESRYISSSKELISTEAVSASGIKRVPLNTVIMSFKLSVGKVAIAASDLFTNEAIMAFLVKTGYDLVPEYIYYYLKGYKWQGSNRAVMGVTLNKASISQGIFKYPDYQEQKRIVAELDLLTEVIDKQKTQLKELNTLAQSIFYDMFGDPIENEKGWSVKKISDVATVKIGPFGSLLHAKDYVKGGHPVINPIHLDSGRVVADDSFTVDETMFQQMLSYELKVNDVVFGRRGDIGRCALVEKEQIGYLCGTGSLFIRFSETIEPKFSIAALMHRSITEYLLKKAKGATMLNINCGIVEDIPLILPPIKLQQEFADKIQSIEKQKAAVNQSIAETQKLLDYTMDKYFG